ncbi:protein of unknown function [Micropruina glycogenica]|uniref:Uncharacterized protein n=1 Tax=Micropruina glycogenica TaxID=75385 RepID=A0A2N9JF35_9ACTN|nr:protein of unknown function [Micropruina glycogenica]
MSVDHPTIGRNLTTLRADRSAQTPDGLGGAASVGGRAPPKIPISEPEEPHANPSQPAGGTPRPRPPGL